MEDKEFHLSLSTKELTDGQNSDTFCSTTLQLVNYKVPLDYFISDKRLLHKVLSEDDKVFHALVVPFSFSKYI